MIKLNTFDILVNSKFYNIINKLIKYKSILSIYNGRYFGIETNDNRFETQSENTFLCYVSKRRGFKKHINKKYIKREYNFWKVITAEANGCANCSFGNMFIGNKTEVHSSSYISFKINNEFEAKSLLSYLKCKLPRFILILRKVSQHINGNVCKWIPLPPLNRIWSNEEIYKYYNLSDEDIKLIKETKIIGYKED